MSDRFLHQFRLDEDGPVIEVWTVISLTLFSLALRRIICDAAPLPRAWCIVSLIFTFAYIAIDQSNIVAFFNTPHVLILSPFLMPLFPAVQSGRLSDAGARRRT